MMTSTAYRQSSVFDAEAHGADPDNVLLSRFPMQRIDAEALRDSILKVVGRLDSRPFGPPNEVDVKPDGEVVSKGTRAGFRRSIYLLQRRSTPLTFLETFDMPPLKPNSLKRPNSMVASQALQLMNSDMARELSPYFAGRVMDVVGADVGKQVERVYLTALSRWPSADEKRLGVETLRDLTQDWLKHLEEEVPAEPKQAKAEWLGLATFCHSILNTADFLYIDLRRRAMCARCHPSIDLHRSRKRTVSRRDFFSHIGTGLHGAALAYLLKGDLFSSDPALAAMVRRRVYDTESRPPHFEPKAKAVIHLFMSGGPSQVDLFDPKPLLKKYEGQPPGRDLITTVTSISDAGGMMPSPFKFAKHGESGMEISEVMPHLAQHVDDITLIRSMWTTSFAHDPAINVMQTGRAMTGRASLGAWMVYGLGSENQNLPAYVVLDDPKGLPINGIEKLAVRIPAATVPGHARTRGRFSAIELACPPGVPSSGARADAFVRPSAG